MTNTIEFTAKFKSGPSLKHIETTTVEEAALVAYGAVNSDRFETFYPDGLNVGDTFTLTSTVSGAKFDVVVLKGQGWFGIKPVRA